MRTTCIIIALLASLQAGMLKANITDTTGVAAGQVVYKTETLSLKSTIYFDGDHTLNIGVFKADKEKAKIQLLCNGIPVFSATYRNEQGITERFDLQALAPGTYTVRISKGSECIEKEFRKISAAAITFE